MSCLCLCSTCRRRTAEDSHTVIIKYYNLKTVWESSAAQNTWQFPRKSTASPPRGGRSSSAVLRQHPHASTFMRVSGWLDLDPYNLPRTRCHEHASTMRRDSCCHRYLRVLGTACSRISCEMSAPLRSLWGTRGLQVLRGLTGVAASNSQKHTWEAQHGPRKPRRFTAIFLPGGAHLGHIARSFHLFCNKSLGSCRGRLLRTRPRNHPPPACRVLPPPSWRSGPLFRCSCAWRLCTALQRLAASPGHARCSYSV